MRNRFLRTLAFLFCIAVGAKRLEAVATPDVDPEGDTGALKEQVQTGGSYNAHSGNASRIVPDLHVPNALGTYGLDFTRYWNSVHEDDTNSAAECPMDFGDSGWSHSWKWSAVYDYELPDTEQFPPPYTYETSITVTFPDGHATKFKLTRGDLNTPPLSRDHRVGPPYYATNYETNWAAPGPGAHDMLAEMAQDGSQFWLYRADGGSVHFVGFSPEYGGGGYAKWLYKATEVYDPHGLRTDLIYDFDENSHRLFLRQVVQEGGSWLNINWASYNGQPVIGNVQTGGNAGFQQVYYKYALVGSGGVFLYTASYPNGNGSTTSAFYQYQPNVLTWPLLKWADDPHFPGAMTKISYSYWGQICDQPPPPNPGPQIHDWYNFLPEAIGAEMSGETGAIVARFGPACQDGKRRDYNGLGGERILYYGGSANDGDITGPLGHSLNKVSDYYQENYPPPSNLPSRKQNQVEPTKVWDGRHIETDLTYDDSGGVASIHHVGPGADGSTATYDRVDLNNLSGSLTPDWPRMHNRQHHWLFKKTDELGNVTVYQRDERRRVTNIYYYDAWNNLVASEAYTYNEWNQVTTHTLPSGPGAIQIYEYDAVTHRLTGEHNSVNEEQKAYDYDGLGRVWRMRDARALADGAPYTEQMEYNSWHQITKIHYRATGGSLDPAVTYEYDRYGNRTAVIDELGNRKDYTYDSYRRCTSLTEQTGSSTACGGQVRRWDWLYNRVIDGINHPALSHTSKEWSAEVGPAFNPAGQRRATARTFDVNNRIVSEQTGLVQPPGPIDSTNPWVAVSETETHTFTYDGNGQKETSIDGLNRETTYTYDLRNRLATTIEPNRQGQQNPVTQFFYDVAGNKTKVIFPDSTIQEWRYFDPFGQPRQVVDKRGNTTDLNYWPWGPMKKLAEVITHREKDGGGPDEDQHTQFFYDLTGRPQTTSFPDGSTEVSTYELGQLKTYKTRKGQTKTIDLYDARGRERHHYWRTFEGNVDSMTPAVSRVWDDASRLSSISNVFSTVAYTYDGAGQVRTESTTVAGDGVTRTVGYCRYPSGDVSQITYPNEMVITRLYTSRGQVQSVGWGAGSTSYDYNRDGTVNYQARTNNVTTTYGYDGRGIISSVRHTKGNDLAKRDYWRDNRDRILAWKRGSDQTYNLMEDGRGDRYGYDEEGELTGASYRVLNPEVTPSDALRTDIFHYDKLGNRMGSNYLASRGPMTFTRKDNGLNQYHDWSPLSTLYDDDIPGWGGQGRANGVLMVEGWITGSYNALNQPVGVTTGEWNGTGNWMWFGYDPLGRCVKRWVGPHVGTPPNQQVPPANSNPATTIYFTYDGWNLIQEGASGVQPSRVYVHGGRTDEIVASWAGSDWNQHQYNAQGNCILLTDSGGNILEQYDYDAFGFPYVYDRWGNYIGGLPGANRFLFTGREWIKELRLYDYRARMYQPELGRFLQPDPKEFAAGDYNLYRYCHNDPVNKSDPTGLLELTASIWNHEMWLQGGSFLSSHQFDAVRQGSAHMSWEVTGQRSRSGPQEPQGRGGRAPSTSDAPLRMTPQPQITNKSDGPFEKTVYDQLQASDGTPLSGGDLKFQEVTTQDFKKNAFRIGTSDDKPAAPLLRGGLFKDHVGFRFRPEGRPPGTPTLEQRFRSEYPNGLPGPTISTHLRQVTTLHEDRSVTIDVRVIEP